LPGRSRVTPVSAPSARGSTRGGNETAPAFVNPVFVKLSIETGGIRKRANAEARASISEALRRSYGWERIWRRAARLAMTMGDQNGALDDLGGLFSIHPVWTRLEVRDSSINRSAATRSSSHGAIDRLGVTQICDAAFQCSPSSSSPRLEAMSRHATHPLRQEHRVDQIEVLVPVGGFKADGGAIDVLLVDVNVGDALDREQNLCGIRSDDIRAVRARNPLNQHGGAHIPLVEQSVLDRIRVSLIEPPDARLRDLAVLCNSSTASVAAAGSRSRMNG
jgi:hypothetical protein